MAQDQTTTKMRRLTLRTRRTMALAAVSALAIVGCGDDDGEVASDKAASGGNLERYCELQRELQSAGDVGTLDAVSAAAPPEIAEEVATVTSAYKVVLESGDEDAAESVAEQEAAMHAFNEDRCAIPNPLDEE